MGDGEIAAEVRQRIKNNVDNKEKFYQNKIKEKATKSVNTVMIGALSDFEEEFGELWGFGLKKRTPKQEEMYQKWQKARTSILDRGNISLKILVKCLERCKIAFYDYKYNTVIKVGKNER